MDQLLDNEPEPYSRDPKSAKRVCIWKLNKVDEKIMGKMLGISVNVLRSVYSYELEHPDKLLASVAMEALLDRATDEKGGSSAVNAATFLTERVGGWVRPEKEKEKNQAIVGVLKGLNETELKQRVASIMQNAAQYQTVEPEDIN